MLDAAFFATFTAIGSAVTIDDEGRVFIDGGNERKREREGADKARLLFIIAVSDPRFAALKDANTSCHSRQRCV